MLQIRRTSVVDNPPDGLLPGQLAVEMANNPSPRLWVGVPASIDPALRRELGGANALPAALLSGQARLRGDFINATTYSFSVSDLIVRDAQDQGLVIQGAADIQCNIGTIGVNGRDQSTAFAASTWIHFYWIYNETTRTLATIASVTLGQPNLPAGFTHRCYIGPIYRAASAFRRVIITDRSFFYPDNFPNTGIAGGVWTWSEFQISTAAFVPPNADEFLLWAYAWAQGGYTGGNFYVSIRSGLAYNGTFVLGFTVGQYMSGQATIPNVDQQIFVVSDHNTGVTGSLYVCGYTVPNGAT